LAKEGWPANANKDFIRIGKGEFVHAPRLVLRCGLPDNFIPAFGCQRVDVLNVKIEAERVEDLNMVTAAAVYQPELIELMKSAFDEAAIILPETRRTSAMKVKLASRKRSVSELKAQARPKHSRPLFRGHSQTCGRRPQWHEFSRKKRRSTKRSGPSFGCPEQRFSCRHDLF
jgi:hypothetical protein